MTETSPGTAPEHTEAHDGSIAGRLNALRAGVLGANSVRDEARHWSLRVILRLERAAGIFSPESLNSELLAARFQGRVDTRHRLGFVASRAPAYLLTGALDGPSIPNSWPAQRLVPCQSPRDHSPHPDLPLVDAEQPTVARST